MDDIDVLRQMYAVLCGGVDEALTQQLETGRVWNAKETLQDALNLAEDLYIAGEQASDELSKHRRS